MWQKSVRDFPNFLKVRECLRTYAKRANTYCFQTVHWWNVSCREGFKLVCLLFEWILYASYMAMECIVVLVWLLMFVDEFFNCFALFCFYFYCILLGQREPQIVSAIHIINNCIEWLSFKPALAFTMNVLFECAKDWAQFSNHE